MSCLTPLLSSAPRCIHLWVLSALVPEDSEHGRLSPPQLVILPERDPAVSALTAADVRSVCVQGRSQIASRLNASTLGEEAGWYLEAGRVVALAADRYNPCHEECDVEHEFWHLCCSQQSFSVSPFPVAGSGLPRVCFGRGEGKQVSPQ